MKAAATKNDVSYAAYFDNDIAKLYQHAQHNDGNRPRPPAPSHGRREPDCG